MSDQETNKDVSPEEIKAMQEKMTAFYNERIPFMKIQCEYEEVAARIETARATRMEMIGKQSHFGASMMKTPEKPVQESTKKD